MLIKIYTDVTNPELERIIPAMKNTIHFQSKTCPKFVNTINPDKFTKVSTTPSGTFFYFEGDIVYVSHEQFPGVTEELVALLIPADTDAPNNIQYKVAAIYFPNVINFSFPNQTVYEKALETFKERLQDCTFTCSRNHLTIQVSWPNFYNHAKQNLAKVETILGKPISD
jgi:hypothetical protein